MRGSSSNPIRASPGVPSRDVDGLPAEQLALEIPGEDGSGEVLARRVAAAPDPSAPAPRAEPVDGSSSGKQQPLHPSIRESFAIAGCIGAVSATLAFVQPLVGIGVLGRVLIGGGVIGAGLTLWWLRRREHSARAQAGLVLVTVAFFATAVAGVLLSADEEDSKTPVLLAVPPPPPTPTPAPRTPGRQPAKVSMGPRPRKLSTVGGTVYGITDRGVVGFDPRARFRLPRYIRLGGSGWPSDLAVAGGRAVIVKNLYTHFIDLQTRAPFRDPLRLSNVSGLVARSERASWFGDVATSKLHWFPDAGAPRMDLPLPGRPHVLVADGPDSVWAGGETANGRGYVARTTLGDTRVDYRLRDVPETLLVDDLRGVVWAPQPTSETIVCLSVATRRRLGPPIHDVGPSIKALIRVDGTVFAFDSGRKRLLELRIGRRRPVREIRLPPRTTGVVATRGAVYAIARNGRATRVSLGSPQELIRSTWQQRWRSGLAGLGGALEDVGAGLVRPISRLM